MDKVKIRRVLKVLIETLWNVNTSYFTFDHTFGIVLIETLWNVNGIDKDLIKELEDSFNRNIVECKYGRTACHTWPIAVLIETLWNVNMLSIY